MTPMFESSAARLDPDSLKVSSVQMTSLSDRFELRRMVGEGGMGCVYEGLDRETGGTVAIKIFSTTVQEQRFEREAELLAACDDPAIVRYIAHGTTEKGELFLAMEWLDGVDLAARLAAGPMDLGDALEVTLRAGTALAHAHARGIVHRDVKPSNVFLVGGSCTNVKLIDFGVARAKSKRALTRTNVFLGTVGYMAPEQVMGLPDIDGRADVFALGCVLYECLTGVPAYAADEPLSVFAKLLVDEPPRLAKSRPEMPVALDAVIARMLARQRDQRYQSVPEALADLRAIAAGQHVEVVIPRIERSDVGERRVVSFIAVDNGFASSGDRTVTPDQVSSATGEVLGVAQSLGLAKIIELDGIVVLGTWEGAARDRATRAVQCALSLAAAFPTISIGVATGASDTQMESTDSEVIRRALGLARVARTAAGIPIDELTADLASEAYSVTETAGTLRVQRAAGDVTKQAPLMGRQRELSYLETSLAETVDEAVARSVVVVGPEGSGKSRLVRAFLERRTPSGLIIQTAGNVVAAGEPFLLLKQLLREVDDLAATGTPSMQPRLLAGDAAVLTRIRTATGEPPVPEVATKAITAWLRRLATRFGSIVLVVEDLHWVDAPSVAVLAAALRELEGISVLLVSTTRPSGRVLAASLFSWSQTTELRLQPLSSRASEMLVRALLEREVTEDVIERIVASADGNPFSLGVLVRHVNRTGTKQAPETVLAVIVARLESLKDDERAVVRAASVFGRSFPSAAVASLLRKDVATIEPLITSLAKEDLVVESGVGVYRFRHELYARAAYEMIASGSRQDLHKQAAEVLLHLGAAPLTIAHQYRYAGMSDEAAEWYVRVAEETTQKFTGTPRLRHGDADGEAEINRAHAAIIHCRDDRLGVEWLLKGFAKAPVGSHAWWRGLPLAVALYHTGSAIAAVVDAALPQVPTAELPTTRDFIRDLPEIVWFFGPLGFGKTARLILDRVDAEVLPRSSGDPLLELAFALFEVHGDALLGHTEALLERTTVAALEAGERASALNGRMYLALVQGFTGRVEAAVATLNDVVDLDEYAIIARSAKVIRGMFHGVAGRWNEALRDIEAGDGDAWLAVWQSMTRVMALSGSGRFDQAVTEGRVTYGVFGAAPSVRITVGMHLAEAMVEQGDYAGALPIIEDALGVMSSGDDIGFASFHFRFLSLRARCLTELEAVGAADAVQTALDRVNAEVAALVGEDAQSCFRNLPVVAWVLANPPAQRRKTGVRDTVPQVPGPFRR
jgi:predicted Ser/Thr protein kinase